MFAPREQQQLETVDELPRLLRTRYGPFVQNAEEMERLFQLLADAHLFTMDDVAARLRKNSLYALSPPIPMAVLSLLHEAYGQQIMRSPVYGETKGKFTNEPLPVWTATKRLLADVFFFFEYLYEDGDGDDTSWPALTRMNRTSYRHSKSSRLPEEDKNDYYGQIAIRDTRGIVRVEILKTLKLDKSVGTKEEIIRRTSSHLTQSQAHFVKRNIFEEEIKELRRQYEMGLTDPHGYTPIQSDDSGCEGEGEHYEERSVLAVEQEDNENENEITNNNDKENRDCHLYGAQFLPVYKSTRPRSKSTGTSITEHQSLANDTADPEQDTTTSTSTSSLLRDDHHSEPNRTITTTGDDNGSKQRLDDTIRRLAGAARRQTLDQRKSKTLDVRSLPTRRSNPSSLAGPHNLEHRMERRKTRSKSLDLVKRQIVHVFHHQQQQQQQQPAQQGELSDNGLAGSSIIESVEKLFHRHEHNRKKVTSAEPATCSSSSSSPIYCTSTSSSSIHPAIPAGSYRDEGGRCPDDITYSMSIVGLTNQSLDPQPELDDGELVVRFFGMKDHDHMLKIAGNLSRAEIDVGPWDKTSFRSSKRLTTIAKSFSPQNMYGGMKVHGGFYQVYKSINKGCIRQHGCDLVERVVQRLGPDSDGKRIVFTGHSMGAALAAIAAYQLAQRYPELSSRLFLIQFGAPRYARKKLARWLNKELDGRIMQIHLEGDQTPKSPPSPPFFGWYAPGPVIEITSKHLYSKSGGKDEFGNEAHFQYWTVLRTILAYS